DVYKRQGYVPGQVVIYQGSSYVVNVPNPQGTPGSSPDYTLISAAGTTGPTGATGSYVGATGFNPGSCHL
ncbi:hypothetical protein JDS83_33825, partial [Bacillus cereus]|nr:hypothetical protein [Bacillus cereus]